jgi:hypothetical protein
VAGKKLIGEFLLELGKSKHGFADYAENREAILAESGLTKAQQKIVLSDDLEKIRDAIRDEYKSAKVIVVAMFVGVGRRPKP